MIRKGFNQDRNLHVVFVHGEDPFAESLSCLRGITDFRRIELGICDILFTNLVHVFGINVVLKIKANTGH